MSGIAGIWQLDGRPVDPLLLSRMSQRLAHRGGDGEGLHVRGNFGLACQNFHAQLESLGTRQPLTSQAGTVLAFDGRLDNRRELQEQLGSGLGEASDAQLALAACDQFGDEAPARLAGDFALAWFDPQGHRLLLARDVLGVRPLYYTRQGGALLFASEIKALLAWPEMRTAPHDELLADFLLDRVYDQEATFFRGIWSVLPAAYVRATPQGLVTSRYWDFDPGASIRLRDYREYVERFRTLFTQAVARRVRSYAPVAVSVSGGLDSSSILCVADRLQRGASSPAPSVAGVSYVSPQGSPSDEQEFLVHLEAKGIEIDRIPIGLADFLEHAEQSVWQVEAPFLDAHSDTLSRLFGRMRERGARVVLSGHWGDQMLFDQAYLVDLARRMAWTTVRSHLAEFRAWMTDTDPEWFRARFVRDLVKHHLPGPVFAWLRWFRSQCQLKPRWHSTQLVRCAQRRQRAKTPRGGSFKTAHARALYEELRVGYHVLCLEWDNKIAASHGLEMAFPFLDRDVLAFLLAIPGDMQTGRGVPKALLRSAMVGILPQAIIDRRWKASFGGFVNQGMRRQQQLVLDRVAAGGRALARGYVDRVRLTEQLRRASVELEGQTTQTAWSMLDLLSLEVWLAVFFDKALRSERMQPVEMPA